MGDCPAIFDEGIPDNIVIEVFGWHGEPSSLGAYRMLTIIPTSGKGVLRAYGKASIGKKITAGLLWLTHE
jgi:hypothetical protein